MIFGEKSQKRKEPEKKTRHHEPLRRSEGHPRCSEVLRYSEGLPRRDEAGGPEKGPLGFAKA